MTVARGEGSPERLGGALRRLHYKATRRAHSAAARHHNNTPPKVRIDISFTDFFNTSMGLIQNTFLLLLTPVGSFQKSRIMIRFDGHAALYSPMAAVFLE